MNFIYFTDLSRTDFKYTDYYIDFLNSHPELTRNDKCVYSFLVKQIEKDRLRERVKKGSIIRYGVYKIVNKLSPSYIYLETARVYIAKGLDMSVNAVIKSISRLKRFGFLEDVRCVLGQYNKIFLKYPSDAKYQYTIQPTKQKKYATNTQVPLAKEVSIINTAIDEENAQDDNLINENNKVFIPLNEKSDPEFALSESPYINQNYCQNNLSTNDNCFSKKSTVIIAQLDGLRLEEKQLNTIEILSKGTTNDEKLLYLEGAVLYCIGKTPSKGYFEMLVDALKKGYHLQTKYSTEPNKPKDLLPEQPISPKFNSPGQYKKKKTDFTAMHTHNWELDELEELASNYTDYMYEQEKDLIQTAVSNWKGRNKS